MMFDWKKQRLATPGVRYQGQIVDLLVTALVFAVSAYLVKKTTLTGATADILIALPPSIYYLLSDALPKGQSLGKKLIGIAVVSKNTGKPCTLLQSFARNILTPILGALDAVLILLKRRQRLGDLMANTIVISHQKLY